MTKKTTAKKVGRPKVIEGETIQIGVRVSQGDAAFLDRLVEREELRGRAEAVRHLIRLMRDDSDSEEAPQGGSLLDAADELGRALEVFALYRNQPDLLKLPEVRKQRKEASLQARAALRTLTEQGPRASDKQHGHAGHDGAQGGQDPLGL